LKEKFGFSPDRNSMEIVPTAPSREKMDLDFVLQQLLSSLKLIIDSADVEKSTFFASPSAAEKNAPERSV